MSEYTDEQLKKALYKATESHGGTVFIDGDVDHQNLSRDPYGSPDYWEELEISALRAILNALPEPATDDWQTKGAEVVDVADVRIGDRVLLKSIEGSLYEVTITSITTTHEVMLRWNDGRIYESSIERAYLFNRPVQHPDPDEHEVICVFKTTTHDYMISEGRQEVMWTGEYYENSEHRFAPEKIADWSPAKVVIADE